MDASALTELSNALFARARRLGSTAPEDLAQEALRRALESKKVADGDDLGRRKYAFRILHNLFIDEKRAERRMLHEDVEPEPSGETPESSVAERQQLQARARAADEALAQLDDRDRAFLCRSLVLGSAPAAQRELGYPPGSAANACQRRNRLLGRVQRALRGGVG
jgi:DNA-directed RNA polymerase specialized sigma24 family protein